MADELKSTKAINLIRLRTDINLVIDALYLYFEASSSTRSIAKYFWDRKGVKISHVAIFKRAKGFSSIFKKIVSKYIPKKLSSSDKWHVDKTVIKIAGKRYYT
ncbi:hypothetical protein C4N20_10390 [Fusobacterium ulcerans]|uniref:hypothetical protein n=1 Tax=Fusobacterium ulcerans TaxID=861 RepID=UPI0001BC51D5|nr:hypothetical protein [Fusobacterium ulcerans]AVQ28472.1 hypothetical protein C4N20_10390 [Fusobacterium ulcerans]